MPAIILTTNQPFSNEQATEFNRQAAETGGRILGKSTDYMMIHVIPSHGYFFSGQEPNALIEVRSLGYPTDTIAKLQTELSAIAQDILQLDPERLYFNFIQLTREQWKWNF